MDFAADIHALVASDDAEVHGASVDGVRADVQGTFAPEWIMDRCIPLQDGSAVRPTLTWNVPTLTSQIAYMDCLHSK